jgi:hypothetical protein
MNPYRPTMPTRSSWYAEGFRWLGTILHAAADRLEPGPVAAAPLEPHPELLPPDYRVFQLRHRIQSLYY